MFKLTVLTITLLTCLLPQSVKALTWEQVTENVLKNSPNINSCLTSTLEEYNNKQPETPADGLAMIDQKIAKTHHCLNPMFQDYLNDTQIKLNFKNTTFTDKVSINGEFTVILSSLKENSLITKNEITSFKLNNNICESPNLEVFSYQIPEKAKRNFELQYALTIIAKLVDNDPNNQQIISLQNSLESFTKQGNTFAEFEMILEEVKKIDKINEERAETGEPLIPLPSFSSNSYIDLEDNLPQLHLECTSEKGNLSVNNGVSEITFIEKRESQSSGMIFSSSSNTQTITIDGQTLTIKTTKNNNSIKTTYKGLPLSVFGNVNVVFPKN
jgi:hypothetical protein